MDLLSVLGLDRPAAECAVCFELYADELGAAPGAGEAGTAAALDALALRCMQALAPHVAGYIWQHEPFRLQSSLQQTPPWLHKRQRQQQQQRQQQPPPFLWGALRYEDNVEDEWFVVWLLLELTRVLPGVSARAWDDDGEFMLIEGAYALPRWLKPETATNRVWLRGGHVHVVPPPSPQAPTLPAAPSVADALAVLRSGAVNTRRSRLEGAIAARLSGYPAKARQQRQNVRAWLPRRVALLLQAEPQLVAGAVGAFMTRQREELASATRLARFPPVAMTTARVSLNRCMYAQLLQADFTPPRGFPQPPSGAWLGGSEQQQRKAFAMGLSLTLGFELLAARLGLAPRSAAGPGSNDAVADGQQQQQQQQQQQPQAQAQPSLAANPVWHAYLAALQRSGYFDGELEGSARHRQLMAAAREAFTASESHARSSEALAAPARRLQQLLDAIDAPGSSARGAGGTSPGQQQALSPAAAVLDADELSEDSDSWLEEQAAALSQQLEQAEALAARDEASKQQRAQHSAHQQQQQQQPAAGAGGAEATAGMEVDAEQLLAGFQGFVQHVAGPDGAEVPAARRQQQLEHERGSAGDGVAFNADAIMTELLGVLGGDPAAAAALSAAAATSSQPARARTPAGGRGAAAAAQQSPAGMLAGMLAQLEAVERLAAKEAHLDSMDASDDYGSSSGSSDEGSSFYDEQSDDGNEPPGTSSSGQPLGQTVGAAGSPVPGAVAPRQLAVPPPASSRPAGRPPPPVQLGTRAARLHEAWEVATATDSDDESGAGSGDDDALSLGGGSDAGSGSDGGDAAAGPVGGAGTRAAGAAAAAPDGAGFFASYTAALDAELAATTLADSFERAAGPQPGGATAADSSSSLAPLDVDINLIKSLVASYTAQGGLPGPASNLAGLLGLTLPTQLEEVAEAGGGRAAAQPRAR